MATRRRVVTGSNADGKSVIVSDEQVDAIEVALAPGSAFHRIWGADVPQALPHDGTQAGITSWFPPAGGFRFMFLCLPPDAEVIPPADMDAALSEAVQKLPGLLDVMDPGEPGMHRTDTVDMVVILSGSLWLQMDEGETEIRQGDCVVQNGTRHAWRNRGTVPCEMLAVMIGAKRD